MESDNEPKEEDLGIELLEKWLPRLSREKKAFLKGASEALLYAQKESDPAKADQE